jgi:hypothetical protein
VRGAANFFISEFTDDEPRRMFGMLKMWTESRKRRAQLPAIVVEKADHSRGN